MDYPRIKKPGRYKFKAWRYELDVEFAGTKSERMQGTLFKNGEPISGSAGDQIETPLATFVYINRPPYQSGWLSVLSSSGSPVFLDNGQLTESAQWCVENPIEDS